VILEILMVGHVYSKWFGLIDFWWLAESSHCACWNVQSAEHAAGGRHKHEFKLGERWTDLSCIPQQVAAVACVEGGKTGTTDSLHLFTEYLEHVDRDWSASTLWHVDCWSIDLNFSLWSIVSVFLLDRDVHSYVHFRGEKTTWFCEPSSIPSCVGWFQMCIDRPTHYEMLSLSTMSRPNARSISRWRSPFPSSYALSLAFPWFLLRSKPVYRIRRYACHNSMLFACVKASTYSCALF
jgi:hypothetical protein